MIPLVVALWEQKNFGGRRRLFAQDEPDLPLEGFNDATHAVGVHPGPDYASYKAQHGGQEPIIGLYQDTFFGGAELILTQGSYPNIDLVYNFGGVVSSVKIFQAPRPPAATIAPIPFILHVWKDAGRSGDAAQIVESVNNVASYLGGDWSNQISSLFIQTTPQFTGQQQIILFEKDVFNGGQLPLQLGRDYSDLALWGFNDKTNSIKIVV
jgi:hypothetical protein